MYKHRYIENKVRLLAKNFKVVLVVGARQVGKSTLLKNLFPTLPHFTFNPLTDPYGARRDPQLFLSQLTGPVILDEIQFAPELLAFIKLKVDESDAMGQYFLTGSQNLSMLKAVAESMAGRVAIIEMSPMIVHELAESFITTDGAPQPPHWLEVYMQDPLQLPGRFNGVVQGITALQAMWRGGLPHLHDKDEAVFSNYFDGYLKTYIERDIRSLSESDQLMKFTDFVGLLATKSAQEINYTELGREVGLHRTTADRWLMLVESTYVWHHIRPFLGNTLKRLSERDKGYFFDTGLICHLLHISTPLQILKHPLSGSLFETYIGNTILTILEARAQKNYIHHWRAHREGEVDIVLEFDNSLYPIEVKLASTLNADDTKGIRVFNETYRKSSKTVMPGIVVYAGERCYLLDHDIIAVPWHMLCSSEI